MSRKSEVAELKAQLAVARRRATKAENAIRNAAEATAKEMVKEPKRPPQKARNSSAPAASGGKPSGGLQGLSDALRGSGVPAPAAADRSDPPGKPAEALLEKMAKAKAKEDSKPPPRTAMKAASVDSDQEQAAPSDAIVPNLRPATGGGSVPVRRARGEAWVHTAGGSAKLRALELGPGDVVEAALPNDLGDAWGARVLYRIRAADDVDASGQFVCVEFGGASDDQRLAELLREAFPALTPGERREVGGSAMSPQDGGPDPETVVHFCSKDSARCKATFGGLHMQHVEMVRRVDLSSGAPDWMDEGFDELKADKTASSKASDRVSDKVSLVPAWAIRGPCSSKASEGRDRGPRKRGRSGRRSDSSGLTAPPPEALAVTI